MSILLVVYHLGLRFLIVYISVEYTKRDIINFSSNIFSNQGLHEEGPKLFIKGF